MLCDCCITKIASQISKQSKRVIKLLAEQGRMNQSQIQHSLKLSFAVTHRIMAELRGSQLVSYEGERSHIYFLTESGLRLIEILKGGK